MCLFVRIVKRSSSNIIESAFKTISIRLKIMPIPRCDIKAVTGKTITGFIFLISLLFLCAPLAAEDPPTSLPPSVQSHFNAPPVEIGHSTYRKFGFRIYNVSLWARDKNWDPHQPFALKLHYTRDLSKGTLVDTAIDDIRDQNVADDATITRWQAVLNQDMPDVEEDDELIGLYLPGHSSMLFYNGKQIASIDDKALSKAFFDIWLGDQADEDMRNDLLGRSGD